MKLAATLALLPVFLLAGLTAAFFRPLALAYVLAILASMVVADSTWLPSGSRQSRNAVARARPTWQGTPRSTRTTRPIRPRHPHSGSPTTWDATTPVPAAPERNTRSADCSTPTNTNGSRHEPFVFLQKNARVRGPGRGRRSVSQESTLRFAPSLQYEHWCENRSDCSEL